MLEFNDVSYGWSKDQILQQHLNLQLTEGTITTVLGCNGCGKSSLFSIFAQPRLLLGGSVCVMGHDMRDLSLRELFSKMAIVAQNTSITYPYSVLEYVLTGWYPWLGLMGSPDKSQRLAAVAVLQRLGIDSWQARTINTLSGGEFKLVQLARALIGDRRIILLDEIDSALDFANQMRLIQHLRRLEQSGAVVMLISHNPNLALTLKSQVLLLSSHLPYQFGSAEHIVNPHILSQYFGVNVGQIEDPASGYRQVIPQ